jgi:hypothetical protein
MKKEIKGYHYIICCQVYPFDLMISVDESDLILEKELLRRHISKEQIERVTKFENTTKVGHTLMLPTGQTIVRLKTRDRDRNSVIACLSHEIFHVVTFVLQRVGIKFKMDSSDEAYAYLIEWVTKQALDKLK